MPPHTSFPPPPAIGRSTPPLHGFISLCAVLGAVLLLSSSAFAGHYEQATTYNGTTDITTAYSSDSYDWQTYGISGQVGAYEWSHGSCHLHGTVTVTFTWIPDPTLASDPPPQTVYVTESAEASWSAEGTAMDAVSGSRSVSVAGQTIADYNYGDLSYKNSFITKSHTHQAGGGASFSVTGTLDSQCSGGGPPTPGEAYTRSTSLYIYALYSVSIHAHPYNFRKDARRQGDPPNWINPDTRYPGQLQYRYTWDSTSGNRADLSRIQIDENVDYGGNAVGDYYTIPLLGSFYRAPDPPFANTVLGEWVYRNPTRGHTLLPFPRTTNAADDYYYDTHKRDGWFTFPHDPLRWTFDAKQVYEYHCPDCMAEDEWRPIEDGPEAKVHTISRTFYCLDDNNTTDPLCWWTDARWRYETTKDGDTAWMEMSRFSPPGLPIDWGPW